MVYTPRTKSFYGNVHYALDNGRPACGSAPRHRGEWFIPSDAAVTCGHCLSRFGADLPCAPLVRIDLQPEVTRRAAERAARRAARMAG